MDIETPRKQNPNIISCGFADDSTHGVSFIFYPSWFIDGEEGAKAAKDATRDLLASSIPKIMHNGPSFDYLVLEHRGYHVNSFQWDTICAAHQLYAELPRDLGTLTSIYTDQPYHKGMLKEATKDGMHYLRLGEYNALDCMTTYEIAEKQKQELGEEGVKFHQKFYMDLTPPLKEAALDGVRVDLIRLKGIREDVKKELVRVEAVCKTFIPPEFLAPTQQKAIEERRAKIATLRLTGKHLCKDGTESKNYLRHIDKLWKLENADHIAELNMASPLAIKHLLFSKEGFGLRPRREKGKVSTSEKVLNKLVEAKTPPEEIKPFIAGLLDYRGAKKLIDSYLELKPDKDNRVRCVYNLGRTKTGRLSSSKSIFGTGLNLQTIPKRKGLGGLIRSIFLPDEGDVFVKRDLCQAESRVVAYEAGEKRLIELFEGGGDVFRTIGAMAFNKKPEDITNAERAKCKIVEHGGNYGQETAAMAYELSMPLGDAASLRSRIDNMFPFKMLWQNQIIETIEKVGSLSTAFSRKRTCFGKLVSWKKSGNNWEKLLDRAYWRDLLSYIPQSTVGDYLNQGLVKVWVAVHLMEKQGMWKIHRPKFRLQIHDEMVWSCAPEDADLLMETIEENMKIPITINGVGILLPSDGEVSKRLADIKE